MRVLVLFANPIDSERLRLDKEDRAFQDIFSSLEKNNEVEFVRRHATSVSDFIDYLSESSRYEIIQFSGHGESNGIYLEKSSSNGGTILNFRNLYEILRQKLQSSPPPRILILMSCFSAEFVNHLSALVPYTIAINKEVTDNAVILFVRSFYSHYIMYRSIENAFEHAKLHVKSESSSSTISFELFSRVEKIKGKLCVKAKISPVQDPVLIDLDAVEKSLNMLSIPKDRILTLLSRKIRIHEWIFKTPREKALLSMEASLIGEFSWYEDPHYIKCTKLFKVKKDVDPELWSAWSHILVEYNDLASKKYRILKGPVDPYMRGVLSLGLDRLRQVLRDTKHDIDILMKLGHTEANLAYTMANNYYELSEKKYENEDLSMVISYLESALSSIHDIIDSIVPFIIEEK